MINSFIYFQAYKVFEMSQLSLDSLEDGTFRNYRNKNALSKIDQCNLKGRFSKLKRQSFYLEQQEFTNLIRDTRPDETAFHVPFDNRGILCTGVIIARDNIEKMPGMESTSCKKHFERDSTTGRIPVRQKSRGKSVMEPKFSLRSRFRDSSNKTNLLLCSRSDAILEKNEKKLGNVILPKIDYKPKTYLELYRRKFSAERKQCIFSPEGSTLSICGDSLHERHLTDVDSRGSSSTSGDDQSELSFYRRLMEQNLQEPRTGRSCETLDCANLQNQPVEIGFYRDKPVSSSISDSKLRSSRRSISYQPYTIEDYKTLSVPRADRSLGPDQVEVEKKRVWLMRRKSYGDMASARNRQNIALYARKHKILQKIVRLRTS
ncbi:uncharacterized protein LOC117172772 isoform X2 [Belonocnema kinseyi]|uniref:uncharacterized protein LOC117172772 isoform X2 n=1 Tax=Belonocnema kinseyi TaxID=2817044 RepID=UPI00143D96FA|nr:uncharacterized protein LOC117172772 isoform X2 [Belonocnema kinseyi]